MFANHILVLLVCTCNSAVRIEKELMDDKRIEELKQKQEEMECEQAIGRYKMVFASKM